MKWQGEELIRVQSRDELRPGMFVVLNCGLEHPGKMHPMVLLTRTSDCICGAASFVSTPVSGHYAAVWCFNGVFEHRRGALYRLQDPPAEENPYLEQPVPTKRSVRT